MKHPSRVKQAMVAALSLLVVACAPAMAPTSPAPPPTVAKPEPRPSPQSTPGPEITLAFGGDVHFEGSVQPLLADPNDALASVKPVLSRADFSMVNLETAITDRGTRDPKELEDASLRYHFRTDARALDVLASAGVDAVGMANNHTADYGDVGLADTLAAREESAIPVLGVGEDIKDAFAPAYRTIKGTKFAFLAADASKLESNGPNWRAGANNPGLASAHGGRTEALLNAVESASKEADVVVAYMHWGKENEAVVTEAQKSLAEDLSQAGAAIVVGSHVHKPQASGWLNGKTYVAYGLGNFVWYHGRTLDAGMLTVTVQDGKVKDEAWTPTTIPLEGGAPEVLTGNEARAGAAAWQALKKGSGLQTSPPEAKESGSASAETFSATQAPLTEDSPELKDTWRSGCPVPPKDLTALGMPYYGFDNAYHMGKIIVAKKHAKDVIEIFRRLHSEKFPIERMELLSKYGGSDDRSMAANNSSGFNCRNVANTDRYSNHSYGAAIDLNPIQNPYVLGNEILPPEGRKFATVDRGSSARVAKGVIKANDAAVKAFGAAGWQWGGMWAATPDYQHFSLGG